MRCEKAVIPARWKLTHTYMGVTQTHAIMKTLDMTISTWTNTVQREA